MSKAIVRTLLGLTASAALAAPALGASPPDAAGSIKFFDFFTDQGVLQTGCDKVLHGADAAKCSGFAVYTGGPKGDGLHVNGTKSGDGSVGAGSAPTATANLSASGGDGISGAGISGVTTRIDYYVTILPLGTTPTAGLRIPLTFKDAGSIDGTDNSNAMIGGEAETRLRALTGDLEVDGFLSSFDDQTSDTVEGGPDLKGSYAETHHVIFNYDEGDVAAKVSLLASCSFGALKADFAIGHCSASADPFVGFDQGAFDALMGAKTFNLSGAFQIAISPGLQAPAGVPEPAGWALTLAGLGALGAALRRRAARSAIRLAHLAEVHDGTP
jgi:hypothetical protein